MHYAHKLFQNSIIISVNRIGNGKPNNFPSYVRGRFTHKELLAMQYVSGVIKNYTDTGTASDRGGWLDFKEAQQL